MHFLLAFALSFCAPAKGPVIPSDAEQLVVGIAPTWNSRTAVLYRFERKKGKRWRHVGPDMQANVGMKGLAAGRGLLEWCGDAGARKVEGDWRAPAGLFRLGRIYGFGDGLKAAPGRTTRINETMECISDPSSKHYNRIVDAKKVERDWDWARPLMQPTKRKSRTIMVGVNGAVDPDADPPRPNEGSCVLFHIQGPKRRTSGCTTLPADGMDALISWLRPRRKPLYMLMTREQYDELARVPKSGLPKLPKEQGGRDVRDREPDHPDRQSRGEDPRDSFD